jgi:hypothetical protein
MTSFLMAVSFHRQYVRDQRSEVFLAEAILYHIAFMARTCLTKNIADVKSPRRQWSFRLVRQPRSSSAARAPAVRHLERYWKIVSDLVQGPAKESRYKDTGLATLTPCFFPLIANKTLQSFASLFSCH